MMSERRQAARRRALLGGRIEVRSPNSWMLDCLIRDVSETGMRIKITDQVLVPRVFDVVVAGGAPRRANLVWYDKGNVGLQFVGQSETPAERGHSARP